MSTLGRQSPSFSFILHLTIVILFAGFVAGMEAMVYSDTVRLEACIITYYYLPTTSNTILMTIFQVNIC